MNGYIWRMNAKGRYVISVARSRRTLFTRRVQVLSYESDTLPRSFGDAWRQAQRAHNPYKPYGTVQS